MTITAKATQPESIEIEIKAKMTLGEWQRVRKKLVTGEENSWTAIEYARAIDAAIDAMQEQFEQILDNSKKP